MLRTFIRTCPFLLVVLLVACQPASVPPATAGPTTVPVAVVPPVAVSTTASAAPPTARPAASATPRPTIPNPPSPIPSPQSPIPNRQSPIPPTPSPIPPTPTPALAFGLEQSHILTDALGTANYFGRTRIPADPSAFAPHNTVRTDRDAFRGWREYVMRALAGGQVAFVLEMGVDDPPAVVAQRARALALMHPTARPWLIIIGNELNLYSLAEYPIETYYAQLRAAYDAVKTVAPSVSISTDGQNYWEGAPFEHPAADPNASNRIRALLKLFERDQWVPDYITIHIFDSAWAPGDSRELYSLVGRTRFYTDILSGYRLPRAPAFFIGEFGLPVANPIPAAQQGKYWRFFITEREQADLAFLAATWSAATGTRLNYFGGLDTPQESLRRNERGEIVEGVYGLVAREGDRRRPAFTAYERAQAMLRDKTGQIASDGVYGVGAACFYTGETINFCIAQATTGRAAKFFSGALPVGTTFRVEDTLGQPVANAARQERDGRISLDLPGAPAQKTGGPVRILYFGE